MNEEQKKRLLIVLMIMGVVGSLALSITWFIFLLKDIQDPIEQVQKWMSWGFTNFGSLTLGIILKFLLNKKHLKEIQKEVKVIKEAKPKEMQPKEKPKRFY